MGVVVEVASPSTSIDLLFVLHVFVLFSKVAANTCETNESAQTSVFQVSILSANDLQFSIDISVLVRLLSLYSEKSEPYMGDLLKFPNENLFLKG